MKIYISYRRADSQYIVGRIRDRLITAFGENSVFTDVEDVPVGQDFRKVLDRAVKECTVMLVVIGPQWADITDAQGNKRLFDSNDYTRIEIEKGLQREKVPVIPVLVMNARMPLTQDLPESLEDLPFRNAILIRNDPDFNNDMDKLINTINDYETPTEKINKTAQARKERPKSRAKNAKTEMPSGHITSGGDVNQSFEEVYDRRVREVAERTNVKEGLIREWFERKLITSDGLLTVVPREPETTGGLPNAVIEALEGYLVHAEQRSGVTWYELIDDHLVKPILESNRRWFEANLSPLQRQAALWQDQGQGDQLLLTGQALAEVEKWAMVHPDEITEVERDFLEASRRMQEQTRNGTETLVPDENQPQTTSSEVEPEVSDGEEARKQEAARVANLLINNRSQAVFNDQARGEDQLGIKEEVEALAETLLLRDVEPPVAVGIMGGWGSGKSFVMYLIAKYVEETRAKIIQKGWATKEEDSDVPAYVGHIYQINFNAWTYAKSNLWASLMDTIFFSLNRQMQIEQLLAHRGCSPTDTTNLADEVRDCMLAGGKEFIKIYGDGLKFDQDKDLEEWRDNLEYWAHHLFKGNLLWSVMRRRQEKHLDRLKDTEEQLKQLKSRREQFEKSRSPEKKSVTLDAASAKACAQTLVTSLAAFIPEQVSQKAMETLKKQNVAEEDIDQALKDVWEIKGLFNTILKMFSEYKSLRVLTVLFLLIGIALSVLPEFQINFAERNMAMAASFAATLLPLITSGLSWVQKVANFNAKAKVILDDAYKNQQAKQAEEIANSTKKSPAQKITDLQNEVSQGSLAAYDTLINLLEAQAEAERQLIGPSAKYSNLMEFVQSRLDAATYENQLGLMHQVRQDIDELTYSLADGAREDIFPRGKPRVILYIDDLDRCPPQRVVEILEAVQLLLNTKLFVIIMGLDTRYVTRALEKEYKEILQHEGDPSGLDYIEKIIQIPYRVRPIERDNLPNYLAMQMDVEEQSEPEAELVPQEQDHVADILAAQAKPSVDKQSESGPVSQPPHPADQTQKETEALQPVMEADAEVSAPSRNELPAAVIQFKKKDLVDLTACCQQISLSPRSIKRLVNVFKLMKIFWFRARKGATLADRDETRSVKQAAMSLLALSSAYPEVMREVFVYLEGLYRRGQEQTLLFTALNNIKLPAGSARELAWQLQKYKIDIDRLKTMPGDKPDELAQLTLRGFKLSNFNIVRSFSFVGDPVYWTDGEEDTSRANGKDPAKPASKTRATRKSTPP